MKKSHNILHWTPRILGIVAMITLPFIITGALFLLSDRLNRKSAKANPAI